MRELQIFAVQMLALWMVLVGLATMVRGPRAAVADPPRAPRRRRPVYRSGSVYPRLRRQPPTKRRE